jgi:hypothetical protein
VWSGFIAQEGVALFGAEMRHVDGGGGIIGQQAGDLARLQQLQALAQPEDGQRAEKADGVDGEICGHAGHLGRRCGVVHENVPAPGGRWKAVRVFRHSLAQIIR